MLSSGFQLKTVVIRGLAKSKELNWDEFSILMQGPAFQIDVERS